MPTTFNVFSLGVQAIIDPTEGNETAENASALVGQTFGSAGAPLHQNIQTLSPGSTGFGANTFDAYDQNNSLATDTFRIDGGADQTFDAVAAYNITINYSDGTSATVLGGLFQDTVGNTYVAPLSGANQDALEAKAIESITVDSLVNNTFAGLNADRVTGSYVTPDGTVSGSTGDDTIDASFGDTDGDKVDGFDGNADTVDAGAGNDSVVAGDGVDVIYGGDGDDEFDAGAGNDIVYGGTGDDLFTADGSDDTDTLYGGSGDDSFDAGDGDDTIFAGDGNDTIEHFSNTNSIDAGAGDDVVRNVAGTNASQFTTIDGGTGEDTYVMDSNAHFATHHVDLESGQLTFSGAARGSLTGFENVDVIGSAAAVTGDGGDNRITASGDFSNVLAGSAGNDTIYGGGGDDTVSGGGDDDTLYGGTGNDTFEFDPNSGTDTIYGGDGTDTLDARGAGTDFGTVSFFGIEVIYSSDGNDTWNWNTSSPTFFGGLGDDTVYAGDQGDLVYGGGGDDVLDGALGADTLFGGAGSDVIFGGTGSDQLYGGDDADTFIIEDGFDADTIYGGEGGTDSDTLDLSALGSGVTVTFTDAEDGTFTNGADTGTFFGVENIILTEQADNISLGAAASDDSISALGGDDTISTGDGLDTVFAGTGDDVIYGGNDADSLSGGDGQDIISGDAGNDDLWGGAGNDTVFGGSGNDTLGAGAGNDTLDGGAGDDTLTGGTGDDIFVLSAGGGSDIITDFGTGGDQLDTSGLSDVGNALTNQDGTVTADEVTVTGGGGSDQVLTFPSGESVAVPDGTVDTSTPATQFASLVAMGVPPCFVPGTRILTPEGARLVETLRVGDLVQTADHGAQPLLWIGRRDVTFDETNPRGERDKPVKISAGALGQGLPERDLVVSPQHRMVLSGPVVAQTFGEHEVFAIAKALTMLPGVRVMQGKRRVTYYALLLPRHEVIFAEGAPTESFRPGPTALAGFDQAARAEIYQLYPGLASEPDVALGEPARPIVRRRDLLDAFGAPVRGGKNRVPAAALSPKHAPTRSSSGKSCAATGI